ncbi:hypothetical protein MRB53_042314 [Persea americana]|nr:hypothetical protein MRB53_042314 [Persea americana]
MYLVLQLFLVLIATISAVLRDTDAIVREMLRTYPLIRDTPERCIVRCGEIEISDDKSDVLVYAYFWNTFTGRFVDQAIELPMRVTAPKGEIWERDGLNFAKLVKKSKAGKGACSKYRASTSGSVRMVVIPDDEPVYGYGKWSFDEKGTIVTAKATLKSYSQGLQVSSMAGENVEVLQIPADEGQVITG